MKFSHNQFQIKLIQIKNMDNIQVNCWLTMNQVQLDQQSKRHQNLSPRNLKINSTNQAIIIISFSNFWSFFQVISKQLLFGLPGHIENLLLWKSQHLKFHLLYRRMYSTKTCTPLNCTSHLHLNDSLKSINCLVWTMKHKRRKK